MKASAAGQLSVDALREAEERYRILFEKAPYGILLIDAGTGGTIECNAIACKQLGYTQEELLRLKITDVEALETPAETERHMREIIRKGSDDFLTLHRAKSGALRAMKICAQSILQNGRLLFYAICQDVTESKQAAKLLELQGAALNAVANAVVITDRAGTILWSNPAFTKLTGYGPSEVFGKTPRLLKSGKHPTAFFQSLWETILSGQVWRAETINRRKDGSLYPEYQVITPVKDESGGITHFVAIKEDVTERKSLEAQLRQAQKLESIGQLASGIAHEINTPTQYIGDNVRFLEESFRALSSIFPVFEELVKAARGGVVPPALVEKVEACLVKADVGYLTEEIPKSIEQTLEGVLRVSKIVSAMKEFSHPGSAELTLTDLNRAIETTLTVAHNEYKYVAELVTEYDQTLPLVPMLPDEFNQAILNLVVNAAHAIGDAKGLQGKNGAVKGLIRVRTLRNDQHVEVRISDNGTGIPEAVRDRIFDPFFTTKEVGKGTGQGLTIARSVIVDRHCGTLTFDSEAGKGTTFIVRLPLFASPGMKGAQDGSALRCTPNA